MLIRPITRATSVGSGRLRWWQPDPLFDVRTGAFTASYLKQAVRWLTDHHLHPNKAACLVISIDDWDTILTSSTPDMAETVAQRTAEVSLHASSMTAAVLVRRTPGTFVLLLSNTNANSVMRMADDIRHRVAINVFLRRGGPLMATVSIGVAVSDDPELIATGGLMERADTALYVAHGLGGNAARLDDLAEPLPFTSAPW